MRDSTSRRFILRPRAFGSPWPVFIFRPPGSQNLQRSELRVSRFRGTCSTRSEEEFGSGRDGVASERSKSRHKGLQITLGASCVVWLGRHLEQRSAGWQKIKRAPCGAERKYGWAGMYRPSIAGVEGWFYPWTPG